MAFGFYFLFVSVSLWSGDLHLVLVIVSKFSPFYHAEV